MATPRKNSQKRKLKDFQPSQDDNCPALQTLVGKRAYTKRNEPKKQKASPKKQEPKKKKKATPQKSTQPQLRGIFDLMMNPKMGKFDVGSKADAPMDHEATHEQTGLSQPMREVTLGEKEVLDAKEAALDDNEDELVYLDGGSELSY